jgi:tRNA-splicing ligase RtcB
LGCGVECIRTTLKRSHFPADLSDIRSVIESNIPRGDTPYWTEQNIPVKARMAWQGFEDDYQKIISKYKDITPRNSDPVYQLGTLGGKNSNHFVELAYDDNDSIWIFLHSGSRGIGNKIGTHFIDLAKKEMKRWYIDLPNQDLAYLAEGSEHFDNYLFAVNWAQRFASENRAQIINQVTDSLTRCSGVPKFELTDEHIKCHHNYVAKEFHFGRNIYVTRKGAISARKGQLGLIPGSMGAKSYIVRGLGNEDSFTSASHGAGRKMSRTKAKATFSLEDHIKATDGVECRKDIDVLDETPLAYKSIDDVMNAQKDLVEPINTLKQILCIKG